MRDDDMPRVVLAVHGVGNRDRARFEEDLDDLRARLSPHEVRGVFWGDLGHGDRIACLPSGEDAEAIDDQRCRAPIDAVDADGAARGLRDD